MKLLSLDSTYRTWLEARLALSFDEDLNEKFIGLTHDESVFFAEMSSPPFMLFDDWPLEVLTRFLAMHERHELILEYRAVAARFMARR